MSKSIDTLATELGIVLALSGGQELLAPTKEWSQPHYLYRVRLSRETVRHPRDSFETDFRCGSVWARVPTLADVLSCLLSDASAARETFEGFCADFGYDTDSRSALATYVACGKTAAQLERLFSEQELDALGESLQGY